MTRWRVWTNLLFLVFSLTAALSYAQDQVAVEEFRDAEYAYAFRYPLIGNCKNYLKARQIRTCGWPFGR
jgi:hypothetical protein